MVGVPFGAPLFLLVHLIWLEIGRSMNVLLPVCKWLVAEEPVPLSVPWISDAVVGVHGIRSAVGVQAAKICRV